MIGASAPRIGMRHLLPLSACVVAAALPLFGQVAAWTFALLIGCAITRLFYSHRGWHLPSLWVKLLVLGAGVLGISVTYGTITGIEPGLSVLLILVSLKTLETAKDRDIQVLTLLGFFLCLCSLFFSQELSRWLYLAAVLFSFFCLLAAFHSRGAPHGWRRVLGRTGMIILQALPLVIVLFMMFPRSYGGLRFQFGRSAVGFAGLGDRMEPGSIASLALREDVAFRADFPDGVIPPQSELYWRGMVLWRGDGLTWVRGGLLSPQNLSGSLAGDAVRQRIVLQPHGGRHIFALDRPASEIRKTVMETGGYLQSIRPVVSPLRYDVDSRPLNREQRLPADQLEAALRKPQHLSPLVQALAESWRRDAGDSDARVIAKGLQFFTEGSFFYSLQPGTYEQNGLEDFLFRRKIGFCEHFAGAFATLMRVAGVPSRVVLGYHGGQYNTYGKHVIVRQSDAHSWCEVWLKGQGWKRVDPTSVIAPDRLSAGLETFLENQAAQDPSGASTIGGRRGWRNVVRNARLMWDNVSYQWDLRVLNFDEESQRSFLFWIGIGSLDWTSLSIFLAVLVILVVCTLALLLRLPTRSVENAALKSYDTFCALLARRGVPRAPWEGPQNYVRRAASQLPQFAVAIERVGEAYVNHRFARDPLPIKELDHAVRALKRSLRTRQFHS